MPRLSTIPLTLRGPAYHSGVIELTQLPIQGGFGSAIDGESWVFQGLGVAMGRRQLSSGIVIRIRF
ncbi:MAG: hypothetical protein ACJAQ3_002983 [Planctomycetota bacterium]